MSARISKIAVIGHPSKYGGADTELDHQINCWLKMGIEVHICHTGQVSDELLALELAARGCIYHQPFDWQSLKGLHCISFCNGEFLKNLKDIRKYALTTSFVNCMTWNFEMEIEMQKLGLIDFHLYQTTHGFTRVSQKLKSIGTYRPIMFVPWFDRAAFPFIEKRTTESFRFGRISRADSDKFNARQLWIYETMTAPVLKEGLILGWNENIRNKFGRMPDPYIRVVGANGVSQQEFYAFCDAVIMSTDTYENLPRVGFEAMSSGCLLVVDNRGGWKELVVDGSTGWLCADDREFVYKASRCAFESVERKRMQHAASQRLDDLWGFETASQSWENVFEHWCKLVK